MSHEVVPVGDHWALGCQDDHGRGRGSVGGEDLGSIPMAAKPQNVEVMRVNPIRNSSRSTCGRNRRCAHIPWQARECLLANKQLAHAQCIAEI